MDGNLQYDSKKSEEESSDIGAILAVITMNTDGCFILVPMWCYIQGDDRLFRRSPMATRNRVT